jgi:hypothetical protein
MMVRLYEAEQAMGHISWCNPIDSYTATAPTTLDAMVEILRDYGFPAATLEDDGVIDLQWWGGDKLGSCIWEMLHAIAAGFDPNTRVEWIMHGEDDTLWADVFANGVHSQRDVILTVAD